jgi:hypothetical protein
VTFGGDGSDDLVLYYHGWHVNRPRLPCLHCFVRTCIVFGRNAFVVECLR